MDQRTTHPHPHYHPTEQAHQSLRIRPSMANRDQERGLTNQRVRQRENDGRHHQPPQPTVAGSARNPGYNVPRSMLQQVRSPAESHRGQTTLPSNPEAGRKGEPPTPPREHGTPRSLPQTTQVQKLDKLVWHFADNMIPAARECAHVSERRKSILAMQRAMQHGAPQSYWLCRKSRTIPRQPWWLC